ncbi:23S rRNA (pseudouridine1915-N3)-methyltransferase [Rhodobacter aestuarii]|uniref:Ribosomal RNA large subunit methyltransferase H n=1 Tax=Rhodobacter aestuarii TaxID=453582 RepID=A0A1N7LEF7_9RHOB|nr:23S rRNA (pseudouridine(1915)-N(3))-methyltransferase RlmH [Rhodobacter aestuarii]PTV95296.1 23S rRNA (pseudouridine1915-N3)-methyltransferase [Rhodobacter aestuarii]SIS72214.1 23S rRNA (pseudouridine1915-N3)-methyltransferase [Rhodobacter aestuarii]
MKVTICAVGKLRKGPELALISDYLDRFGKAGRAQGLGPASVVEVEDKRNLGMEAEAALLERALPAGAVLITLDERGDVVSSPEFAAKLGGWRDNARDLAFVIGGADGIAPSLRTKADWSLSFGRMVWPHMMVRVMLSEQLYRAGQILAGTPYHRV